jgi:hypothetical protein
MMGLERRAPPRDDAVSVSVHRARCGGDSDTRDDIDVELIVARLARLKGQRADARLVTVARVDEGDRRRPEIRRVAVAAPYLRLDPIAAICSGRYRQLDRGWSVAARGRDGEDERGGKQHTNHAKRSRVSAHHETSVS